MDERIVTGIAGIIIGTVFLVVYQIDPYLVARIRNWFGTRQPAWWIDVESNLYLVLGIILVLLGSWSIVTYFI